MLLALTVLASPASAQIMDKGALLARQRWRDNRDESWFAERIPAFDSPDTAMNATYYYRWELVTKHLTYGSPQTGYTFTEFIDRPFWSGAYGAISCPLGHQLAEIRWLNDPRILEDFARYWFDTPGARPRGFSNWYASAIWGAFQVNGDTAFLRRLLPYMKRQYAGWVAERWDAAHRMFRWDGLHDGMERNINSRQTDDIDEGAEGYRPTLNSYLYGDARAIARASAVLGDRAGAQAYDARADSLRRRVQDELWDERREFFLHQFARDEKDGVKALSHTYDSGRHAGDEHGRELIGYVPWQFHLPESGKGYERAWRFLMDSARFLAPFGPTTTERHDPLFQISSRCCWWSGNSWPYATTQTLVAMANLLNDYRQDVVTARDWMTVFDIYTRTQRKNGEPYVAEGADPDNGSWDGYDTPYHSEHYFHSAYVDLVVTGVVGLRPRADDSVEVNPLAPRDWTHFALEDLRYHGRRLSILWDRDGTRYGRGQGLTILADGRVIAREATLGKLVASLDGNSQRATVGGGKRATRPLEARRSAVQLNLAVNNDRGAFPWIAASYAAPEHPPSYLVDGNYWYHESPPNRWTTIGSPNSADTLTLDFGVSRRVQEVRLYVLDDGPGRPVRAPAHHDVQLWRNGTWASAGATRRAPGDLEGHRANVLSFTPTNTSRVRVVLQPRPGAAVGLSELEVWGPPQRLAPPTAAPRDLAFNATGIGFPRASASFTAGADSVAQVNDLRVAFTKYSRNRWTAFGSPNASDWLEIDFGASTLVRAIELYLWGDGAGVRAPRRYTVLLWTGSEWRNARELSRLPEQPQASARNVVTIQPVRTQKVRVVFEHDLPAVTGVTELVVRGR